MSFFAVLFALLIQQLKPLKLPPLGERQYYRLIVEIENVPAKYSYGQVCEAVDIANQLDRNFTVAASRLKRSSLTAVQAMEAFGIYCCAIKETNQEYKRAYDQIAYYKDKIMNG